MTTSAPIVKEGDIPITRPQRMPKRLPSPTGVPVQPFPVRVPAGVPVPIRVVPVSVSWKVVVG